MSCTILLDFRARADTVLVDAPSLTLALRHSALLLTAPGVELDMEDTAPLADGTWHSLAVITGDNGTRIFVDGYQCFSATADVSPGGAVEAGPAVRGLEVVEGELGEREILARAVTPVPLIEFAEIGRASCRERV